MSALPEIFRAFIEYCAGPARGCVIGDLEIRESPLLIPMKINGICLGIEIVAKTEMAISCDILEEKCRGRSFRRSPMSRKTGQNPIHNPLVQGIGIRATAGIPTPSVIDSY